LPVSAGAALEPVTRVPAAVFEALPAVAQAAVVARIVPDRLRSLDQAAAEAVLAVTQRAVNVLAALQDLALAAEVRCEELYLADLDGEWSDGSEHRPSSVSIVGSSVAPLLRLTPRAAEAKVADALCLVDELPLTRAMTLDGLLDSRQSRVIVDVAQVVQVGARALFDAAITSVSGLTELTPARLRRLCERTAAVIDAGSMERRAEAGMSERFVRVAPGVDPGMAWWTASLPSYVSMQAWAAIDELAHEYVRADPSRSIDQARADAFADLLLGSAQVSTTVELVVPTFTDAGSGLGLVPGCSIDEVPGCNARKVPGCDADEVPGCDADEVPGCDADEVPGCDAREVPGCDKPSMRAAAESRPTPEAGSGSGRAPSRSLAMPEPRPDGGPAPRAVVAVPDVSTVLAPAPVTADDNSGGVPMSSPIGPQEMEVNGARDVAGPGASVIERYGLEHVAGPPLAAWHAIGSELATRGSPALGGLPEQSAAHLMVLQQQEAAQREWERLAAGMLERFQLRLGRWRPPTVGVRDPRAGWVLSSVLVDVLSDPDVRLRVTRADALTGVTVARDPSLYRPNAALARRVRDRDRTCRFPGCCVSAQRSDLDHVVRYPEGATTEENLLALCRPHHGFKHHAGWRLEMDVDGVCTWTAPTGRTHVTRPADVRTNAA
jgi:hypothetical protein